MECAAVFIQFNSQCGSSVVYSARLKNMSMMARGKRQGIYYIKNSFEAYIYISTHSIHPLTIHLLCVVQHYCTLPAASLASGWHFVHSVYVYTSHLRHIPNASKRNAGRGGEEAMCSLAVITFVYSKLHALSMRPTYFAIHPRVFLSPNNHHQRRPHLSVPALPSLPLATMITIHPFLLYPFLHEEKRGIVHRKRIENGRTVRWFVI